MKLQISKNQELNYKLPFKKLKLYCDRLFSKTKTIIFKNFIHTS